MKNLLTITDADLFLGKTVGDITKLRQRQAARAVVYDNQGRVGLLFVSQHHYHKLPGGGVEAGEDLATALAREVQEELGCSIDVTGEIGVVTEVRDDFALHQISHCFQATVREMGEPAFTEEEQTEGFQVVWADNLAAAVSLLQHDRTDDYQGHFTLARDTCFLREAFRQADGGR